MNEWLVPPKISTFAACSRSWKKQAALELLLLQWKPNSKSLPFDPFVTHLWVTEMAKLTVSPGRISQHMAGFKLSVWRKEWTELRTESFFSHSFHYETAPCQDNWKSADFSSCFLKKKYEAFNGKIIIILLRSIKQFKADRKESQLFVKHIDLKYERNLWRQGKGTWLVVTYWNTFDLCSQ